MSTGSPPSHPDYRPDIDGLRAVAVLSVVAYHAFPGLVRGGFVGVDVFFVISGFLISSIIFGSLARGSFSIADFYVRRVRRIFPALLVVLGACFAVGWVTLFSTEYRELGKHVASGAGFISNLVLWQEAGYFDASAETKPLLHLWSLGVEEQFYIAWPLLAALMWKRPRWRLPLLAGLALASFAWAVLQVHTAPVAAFYSPLTRFWELMAGAILAWASMRGAGGRDPLSDLRQRWPAAPHVLAAAGAALLAGGLWGINQRTPFPGVAALLPVLGAVLLIAAGPGAWPNRRLLSHPVAVWVGLVSYPLYLWHWPLLSFARIFEGGLPRPAVRAAAVVAALLLAWLTYRFVERPVRKAPAGPRPALALAGTMLAMAMVGWGTMAADGIPSRVASRADLTSQLGWNGDQRDPLCERTTAERPEFCRLSSERSPTILVIGDSMAWQLYFGLAEQARATGDTVLAKMQGGCVAYVGYSPRPDYAQCEEVTRSAVQAALTLPSVKAVVLSSGLHPYAPETGWKLDIGVGPAGTRRYANQQDFRETSAATFSALLDALHARGKRVVYVKPNASLSFEPASCIPRQLSVASRAVCAEPLASHRAAHGESLAIVEGVLARHPEVAVLDLADLLCDDRACWAMRDGVMLYRDTGHLSVRGSELVAPAIMRLVREGAAP